MTFHEKLMELRKSKGLSLDAFLKDIDVQDVRDKNLNDKQLSIIYDDVQNAKSAIHTIVNALCIIGVAGVLFFLLLGIFWG